MWLWVMGKASHFVKEKSIIDNEAFQRGNSVYLVDRVIPMLPEKLSNVLCSLRPKEDKLTFSVVFKMSLSGEILDTWFGKTVIHSNHRFNYEDVQEIIEGQKHSLSNELITLNNMAKTIRSKRLNNGALNIESSEVRFQLNEKGFPIGTFIKISKESHQLIEEFMLLANKYVAMKMGKPHKNKLITPFIFRVHDDPNEEKLNDFPKFAKIDKAIGKEGFKLMLLLRLSPVFPFALSNYLYGASSINFPAFFGGTLLGFAPGTLAYVYTGYVGKALTGDTGADVYPWYVYLGGLALFGGLLKVIADTATSVIAEIEAEDAQGN